MSEDVEDRLSAVEKAVLELRELVGSRGGDDTGASAENVFWALEGLEAQAPEGAVLYTGSVQTPVGGLVRWQYAQTGPDLFAEDWAEHAARLAALGNPVRLRILHSVLHGVSSAARLTEDVDAGTSGQIYHHLKELTSAGWLTSPKRGVFEVPASRIVPLLTVLLAVGTPQA